MHCKILKITGKFPSLQKFLHLTTVLQSAGHSAHSEFRGFFHKGRRAQTPTPQISISRALATVVIEKKVYYSSREQIAKSSIAPYLVQTAVSRTRDHPHVPASPGEYPLI
jgi:hypothetical protein